MMPSPTSTCWPLGAKVRKSFTCISSRRLPASAMVLTTSTPARAEWPTSMHKPQRGSRPRTTSRTDCGVGKFLSSGPWLWMAMGMLYSFTRPSTSLMFSSGPADEHGNAGVFVALEEAPQQLGGRRLGHVGIARAHDADTGGLIFGAGRFELLGGVVEGHVHVLQADPRRLEGL